MDDDEEPWQFLDPTKQNAVILACLTAISTIVSVLLWVFSMKCLAHGFFCGPAGYPDGGSLMMAFATLVTLSLPVLCCYTVELVVANVRVRRGPAVHLDDDDGDDAEEDAGLLG